MTMIVFTASPCAKISVDGRMLHVCAASACEGGRVLSLSGYIASPEVTDVDVHAIGRLGPYPLALPESVRQAIADFLKRPRSMSTDCYEFVSVAHGQKPHAKTFFHRYWKTCRLPWVLRKRGSALFFFNEEGDELRHAALYLYRGLCLSVYGAGGDLEVSSIRQMQEDFYAPKVLIGIPRDSL